MNFCKTEISRKSGELLCFRINITYIRLVFICIWKWEKRGEYVEDVCVEREMVVNNNNKRLLEFLSFKVI